MSRTWRAVVAAQFLALAACSSGVEPAPEFERPSEERSAAAEPPAPARNSPVRTTSILVVAPDPLTDAPPYRVWWRDEGARGATPVVSAAPGGEPLPGVWSIGYFCGEDRRPSFLNLREPFSKKVRVGYNDHWVWVERDGVRWWLFCRVWHDGIDPGFSDEQRQLLGRWRHRERSRSSEIELLEGGLARTGDGETWTWISAGDCLELRRPYFKSVLVINCIVSTDRRSYRSDFDDVQGTRLDPPK